ncbi:MAG: hypothetical protein CL912_23190 [Deltaproteobacteria bacterium]|nr:hypothetical protein [Deltaproteobacteria bacterium]
MNVVLIPQLLLHPPLTELDVSLSAKAQITEISSLESLTVSFSSMSRRILITPGMETVYTSDLSPAPEPWPRRHFWSILAAKLQICKV